VSQLLAALDATGLRENTVVVFVSDHGEMLGERGLWYKMNFFEWSARVPILFQTPARFEPRRVAEPVSLLDLLPTLVALGAAGERVAYAEPPDGRSLLPLLTGEAADNVEQGEVLGEMLGEGAIAPLLMVRRGRYKYVYSEPDPEQLFDLSADPRELENLAGQPAHEEIRRAFEEEVRSRWDSRALRQEIVASQRRRRLVYRALTRGRFSPWDFQPFRDASQQYMRNHLDLNVLERTARFPPPELPPPE
jgi:choline-sulfatase